MTGEKHIFVWNNCLNFIQQNIEPKQFELWFRPIKPVSLLESTLTVEVPSEFFREYLEGAYLDTPVIYPQYDADTFSENHTGNDGYFDYEGTSHRAEEFEKFSNELFSAKNAGRKCN